MNDVSYPHLFSPLGIGPVESRNRVVLGAHFTQFSEPSPVWGEPGFAGARLGRYLAEGAAGEADPAQARSWFEQAAAQGIEDAQADLAALHAPALQ